MFKKLSTILAAALLTLVMVNSALADFGDLSLTRVVLNQTGGTTEIATNLLTLPASTTTPANGTYGGGNDAFTNQAGGTDFANLYATYFAVDNTNKKLWISGQNLSISPGKAVTINGLTQAIFTYYHALLGSSATVLADATNTNAYRVAADGGNQFGQFGSAIVAAGRPSVEANLDSLSTGGSVTQTLYYFANYAVKSTGVAVALITTNADGSTTISPIGAPTAPGATTTSGDAIIADGTTATLRGTVSANNAITTVTFDYGLDTSYGTKATDTQSPLAASAVNTPVSAAISGLTCETAYNFRVVAVNSAGTTNGSDQTFTTAACSTTIGQTITFGTAPSLTYGGATGTVSATASSGLPVTFSSLTPNTCSINGTTVTPVNAGTCTIAADQAGDSTYAAAPQATQSFTIAQASQTITFGPAPSLIYGGANGTVSANANSLLPVATYNTTTPSTCSISGTTVTPLNAGTCTITADQSGNSNFAAAPQAKQDITVSPAPLTVTANYASKTYGQTVTFNGTEFSSVGLQKGETIGSVTLSSPGAAATANVTVSPYVITPSAAIGGTFNAANYTISYANGNLTVSQATPALTWATPAAISYGTPLSDTQLNASANIPGTFSYNPQTGAVLSNGNQTLSVIFTPTDTLNYTTANTSVSLTVTPTVQIMGNSTGFDTLLGILPVIPPQRDSTIQLQSAYITTAPETLTFNKGVTVTLIGGTDASWTQTPGSRTTIWGRVNVQSGKLIASGIAIKPGV